jgi:hypothetical protein
MRIRLVALSCAAVVAAACSDSFSPTQPGAFTVPLQGSGAKPEGVPHNFGTHLSGSQEVPGTDSRATGQAVFQMNADGTALTYSLNVANIQNVTQAHIHCGAAGSNGPVALWLYPSAPPAELIPGRTQGPLGAGTATDGDVVTVAASAVCPGGVASLDELAGKLRTGGAYVNVHTTQFPPGEIRGQIR